VHRRSRPAFAVAALCAAALAGCGPFGDDELTEEEFLAQGDEICEQGREQYIALQEEPPRTASEHAELARQLIEITEGEIADLRELNAPVGSEDALEEYLDAREEGLDAIRDGLEAAEGGDADAYADAQAEVAQGQLERARLAERVGFTECSRPLNEYTVGDEGGSGE
jgi:predicted transcriptional regulator